MKFQLDFSFTSAQKISARHNIVLVGSCFAESIGKKFSQIKFNSLTNPNGIIFNPLSLEISLTEILNKKKYSETDLIQREDLWLSFNHHSSYSSPDKKKALQQINSSIEKAHTVLQKANWLVVTFGSAYVYEHKKPGTPVANCHKFPGSDFEKKLLSPSEIVTGWRTLLEKLREFNPALKVIFTVSPVRYIRDGLVENNISKSVLLLSVNQVCAEENAIYFPAYEIVNDVLRDYRFFKEDLVHPSEQAIEFVWEKFTRAFFDEEAKHIQEEMEAHFIAENHTLLHPGTSSAKNFKVQLAGQKQALAKKYPFLDW